MRVGLRTKFFLLCLAGLAALSGPAASWVQCRERWIDAESIPDALYLVSGEKSQQRRVESLLAAAAARSITNTLPLTVLVGNDRARGRWSREHQRNLAAGEWGKRRILDGAPEGSLSVRMVPGAFAGTDGEMEALALFLESRGDIGSVALVTSGFHIRRVLRRFDEYSGGEVRACAVAATHWTDRAPWIVAGELLKMVRDAMGLSRAPVISRRWWREKG